MSWFGAIDRQLIGLLRDVDAFEWSLVDDVSAFFERAELHGVLGVAFDAYLRAGSKLPEDRERIAVARELDSAGHLAMLARVGGALAARDVRGVALKGALFGERFYPEAWMRATSDIDLLVAGPDIEGARAAVESVGYRLFDDAEKQAWSLREHHHWTFAHASAAPLELHFQAYRGLGSMMPGKPLVARSRASRLRGIRILDPADELVFLSVHAAAHRFIRLGWLYDLKLLLVTMDRSQVGIAVDRAEALGYRQTLGLAALLLHEVLGVSRLQEHSASLGRLREPLLRAVSTEPDGAALRSATRFVFTLALCGSASGAAGYAYRSSRGHASRLLTSVRKAI